MLGLATRARLLPGLTWRAALRPGGRCGADALQDAAHARLDLEIVEPPGLQIRRGLVLRDVGFLRRQLRLRPGAGDLEALLLDGQSVLELGDLPLLLLHQQRRHQAVLLELQVGFEIERRLAVVGFDGRDVGFLREQGALEIRLPVLVRGERRLVGQLRFAMRLFDVGAAQFENDGVRLHHRAGAQDDPFDAARRGRRDPADVFGNQRARAAHLRSIWPRLTVSTQTVARSTLGAAGFSRDTPTVMTMIASSATAP
jgi:hypothetical protein